MLTRNPFLHIGPDRIYDPLSDRTLVAGDGQYGRLRALLEGGVADDVLVQP